MSLSTCDLSRGLFCLIFLLFGYCTNIQGLCPVSIVLGLVVNAESCLEGIVGCICEVVSGRG